MLRPWPLLITDSICILEVVFFLTLAITARSGIGNDGMGYFTKDDESSSGHLVNKKFHV